MAPSDPSGTVLEDCLRVRQSGAIRVLVALVRMIQDLWFVGPRLLDVATGGVWDSFVLLPRILGCILLLVTAPLFLVRDFGSGSGSRIFPPTGHLTRLFWSESRHSQPSPLGDYACYS